MSAVKCFVMPFHCIGSFYHVATVLTQQQKFNDKRYIQKTAGKIGVCWNQMASHRLFVFILAWPFVQIFIFFFSFSSSKYIWN